MSLTFHCTTDQEKPKKNCCDGQWQLFNQSSSLQLQWRTESEPMTPSGEEEEKEEKVSSSSISAADLQYSD